MIKQVVTMFFSVNRPTFREKHPELVRFVLNPDARYLPPKYRVYAFLTIAPVARMSEVAVKVDGQGQNMRTYSEVSFPPFGFVMTFNSLPPDSRLDDITHFARYSRADFEPLAFLTLPVLSVVSSLPGNYQTREELRGE